MRSSPVSTRGEKTRTNSHDDGRLGRQTVRHVDVHVDPRRVDTKVGDLAEGGAEGHGRGGGEAEESAGEHDDG